MIFYYAAGGGLGHLTRARAFLHTLRIQAPVTILTASAFAADRRVVGAYDIVKIPANFAADVVAYKTWLADLFAERQPSAIYLDAFPVGIVGEFCDFDFPGQVNIFHVARLLQWERYKKLLGAQAPHFKTTYLLEDLEETHRDFLRAHSETIELLELEDPPHCPDEAERRIMEALQKSPAPLWLIVHAGSNEEISDLVCYAEEMSRLEKRQPRLVLIAPRKPANRQIEHFDFYPAAVLFPLAERIITAAGFHAIRQTETCKVKHRCIPFARKFDNQFRRVVRRNAKP